MRELRKFAIDNVSHHPHLKLEYIGLDYTVERLQRKVKVAKKRKAKNSGATQSKGEGNDAHPNLARPGQDVDSIDDSEIGASSSSDSDSNGSGGDNEGEDEDEDGNTQSLLKMETLENVKFYDVYGVRICRKDVMAGRL